MDFIFPQTTPIFPAPSLSSAMAPVSAVSPARQQDRITRVGMLAPEDMPAGLLWLAMNYPAICDAMLDKVEYDAIDDPVPAREPEPFCAQCGVLTWAYFCASA